MDFCFFVFCSGTVRSLQRPLYHPRDRGLIDRTWMTVDPPSPIASSSLSLSLSLSPLNRKAALTDSTPPTGMQRGRSAAWKWHHHASCGSIRHFSSRPFCCFFFTRCHRAELYGITRRMKVGAVDGLCEPIVELKFVTWLRAVLENGEPQSRGSTCRGRSGAKRQRLPLSARLGYESCKNQSGGRERRRGNVCHVFLFWAYWH